MNFKNPIILGSKSPRRRQLLKLITTGFQAESIEVEESFPTTLSAYEVATYLAVKKAHAYKKKFPCKIIITSDTTVILDNTILGKPESFDEGLEMLKSLSGRAHEVNTAVHIASGKQEETLSEFTTVDFPSLSDETIKDYLRRFNPTDKAGSYGIQECVNQAYDLYSKDEQKFFSTFNLKVVQDKTKPTPSFIIKSIEGSFFNVVGFPIVEVSKALTHFA